MTKNHPPLSKLDELGFRSYAIFVQSKLLSSIFDLEKLVEIAIDAFVELMRVDVGFIMLFNKKSQQLRVEAVKGLKSHTIRKTRINLDKDIIQRIIERKAGIFISELGETLPIKILFQEMAEKVGGDIVLSIPLVIKKNLVGLVNLGRREFETPFEKADLQFMNTLAGYVAMAIENANLYQKKIEEQKSRITEHKRIEKKLRKYSEHLEEQVKKRTLAEEELKKYREHLEVLVEERTHEVQKLSQAVEQSPVSVIITDIRGDIEYVNPIFSKITGYSSEEVLGRNPRILNAGKLPKSYYKSMWDTILKGNSWSGEFINKKKNGEIFTESMSVSPIFDEAGNITHFVAVKKDITEEKKLQEKLMEAKQAADNANQAKSNFLARMSHEIRTPMNAIIGMTHLTLQTELNNKQRDNLNKVHSSGHSLLGIINDILDFSKIEAGKLDFEHAEFDLEKVFHDFANVITYKAHEKGLEIVIGLPQSVPHILIGDSLRLSQILINLSNNAIKFTEKGEIVIQAELAEKKKGKAKIRFSVKDTGIGLTKEQAGRLFQSFSQADVSTTRKFGGTGLGLAICKNLTEMMNGEIWVESKHGKGSTFFFTAWFGLGKKQKTSEFVPSVDLQGMKVLVCDDNEISRNILKEAMETFSFKVKTVPSGKDAIRELEKSKSEPYELVLMDWKMPEMDGLRASELIRSDKKIDAPPTIIMVTAYNREKVLTKVEEMGLAACLIKPVSYSTLFDTIMEVFGKEVTRKSAVRETGTISEEFFKQVQGALVLLVEDNDVNQDVAVGMLEAAGIQAEIANNGKEAVNMVKSSGIPSKYELVFMDLQMPIMDGYEATLEIRKLKEYMNLPIVAMTADAIAGVKEECFKAGMNDFVTKPIEPAQLYKALSVWIKPGKEKRKKKKDKSKEVRDKTTHQISDSELAKTINVEVPQIEGIDIEAGLRRINNNKTLYLKLLTKFLKSYSGYSEELKFKLLEGNTEEAERMVHTLKGVSGSVGAMDLYYYLVSLDDKLKLSKKINIEKELGQLDKLLSPILKSLAWIQKEKDTAGIKTTLENETGNLDVEAMKKMLTELGSLLENSDFEAANIVKVIKDLPGISKYAEEIESMDAFISDYEFDEALEIVNNLLAKI